MQAVSHVATALVLKKTFPAAPLFGLILATEAVEFLWVALNFLGIERTLIGPDMRSVADVHLLHMPFSHSLGTSFVIAVLAGLILLKLYGKAGRAVALAIALGIVSHILLDLAVHAHDIPLAPMIDEPKLGTGLYANLPLLALGIETLWGVFCWWIYRGTWALLALILILELSALPFYSVMINTGEAMLAGDSNLFALMILAQILLTSVLVWAFAKRPAPLAEPQPSVSEAG